MAVPVRVPILTDTLIDRVLQAQRREVCVPNGWGCAAWPQRAAAALDTLRPDGWCQIGWIERVGHGKIKGSLRVGVWWQIDTGELRRES